MDGQDVRVSRILVLDNYDSFVFNLVQYLGECGAEPVVIRNDDPILREVASIECSGVLVSPGPGRPEDAGATCEVIRALAGEKPILGVCLGHQAIGHVFGARVVRAPELVHGKTSEVIHDGEGVFAGLPSPLVATRYHSLVVDPSSIGDTLGITARTADGIVMGIRHRELDVEGVQFHPESILTRHGHELVANFLARCD